MKLSSRSASAESVAAGAGRETDPTLGVRLVGSDQYFHEVHCIWTPLPVHWIGCWSRRVPDRVRDNFGREFF
jgi:hypothetical protein